MLAILYLLASILIGAVIAGKLLSARGSEESGINRVWIFLPLAFGSGILVVTWVLYALAFIFHVAGNVAKPLTPANAVVFAAMCAFLVFFAIREKKKGAGIRDDLGGLGLIADKRRFTRELVFYLVLFVFILITEIHVFHVKDGMLYSGYTVFSDYAPHTAMIRSFSKSANFPTQYPHYGGSDVKYHFMFQFLAGNLEYLGLRLDWAYNLPSALSLTGFLLILTQISFGLFRKFGAEILTAVLFFFRSGTAFFRFATEHIKAGDLAETLRSNTAFIGYTQNENWGLWNYNVYLNQRHFAFGLLIGAAVIWLFLPCLEAAKGKAFRATWDFERPRRAAAIGVLLGLIGFWNGACLIGALLILFGMALFSDHKLDYIVLAVCAVIPAWIQTKLFIRESAFSFSFYWGFLSEDKSLGGVLNYLLQTMGLTVIGAVVLIFLVKKRTQRVLLVCFLIPVLFALTVSLTPEVAVNQKYIMMAMAFLDTVWAGVIADLWEKRGSIGAMTARRILAAVLIFLLTVTGFYDFVVIVKDNGDSHSVVVDMNSDVTAWLEENTTEKDLVLTPADSLSDITLSGCMMYYGWPYYAWSAGYDTDYRLAKAQIMYGTWDPDELRQTAKEEKIDFIIYEDGMTIDGIEPHEETIRAIYPLVYTSDAGNLRIYKVE